MGPANALTGLSVAGGVAQNFMNYSQNQNNQDFARQAQQREFDFNSREAQIARQYNSIGAQKARMVSAGFNPDLLYGSAMSGQTGQMASGSAGGMPQTFPMQNPFDASLLSGTANLLNSETQRDLSESQENLNNAKAEETKANTKLIHKEIYNQDAVRLNLLSSARLNYHQSVFADKLGNYYNEQIRLITPMINEINGRISLMNQEQFNSWLDSLYKERYWDAAIKGLIASANQSNSLSDYYKSLKSFTDEQRNQFITNWLYTQRMLQLQFGVPDGQKPINVSLPTSNRLSGVSAGGQLQYVPGTTIPMAEISMSNLMFQNGSLKIDFDISNATKDFRIGTQSGPFGWAAWSMQNLVVPTAQAAYYGTGAFSNVVAPQFGFGRETENNSAGVGRAPVIGMDGRGGIKLRNWSVGSTLDQSQRNTLNSLFPNGFRIGKDGQVYSK